MGIFSQITVVLVLVVVLFILLAHRILLTSPEPIHNLQIQWNQLQSIIRSSQVYRNTTKLEREVTGGSEREKPVINHTRFSYSIPSDTTSNTSIQNYSHVSSVLPMHTRKEKTSSVSNVSKSSKKHEPVVLIDSKSRPVIPKLSHPQYSPRPGTDISEQHQIDLLRCPNQSSCIVPELQLRIQLRVYFCKHPVHGGVRFYYLAREGFLLHPNVVMVDESEIMTADYIIYLPASAPWHKSECNSTLYAKKMIVLDEFDGPTPLYAPKPTPQEMVATYGPRMIWYFMYFKRSFVIRQDGIFIRYPHFTKYDIFPLTYPVAEAYIQLKFNHIREIDILCTLRGSKHMTTRQRAQDWVAEYAKLRDVPNALTSQLNTATRTSISKEYFEHMHNSKIIVTVNPANWEGDFRLWEAMSSGALIFVDPLFVPHPYPLEDGVHVIFFSNHNKTELFDKLDYYRANPAIARKIAQNGYLYAMKYHRTVSFADYVLRSAHIKRTTYKGLESPRYRYSAQYLNYEAKRQQEQIKEKHTPGIYSSKYTMKNHTHLRDKLEL